MEKQERIAIITRLMAALMGLLSKEGITGLNPEADGGVYDIFMRWIKSDRFDTKMARFQAEDYTLLGEFIDAHWSELVELTKPKKEPVYKSLLVDEKNFKVTWNWANTTNGY